MSRYWQKSSSSNLDLIFKNKGEKDRYVNPDYFVMVVAQKDTENE